MSIVLYAYLRFSAVFSSNERLHPLVNKLPSVCLASKATNTRKSYKYVFDTWTKWYVSHSIQSLPASDFHEALYFVQLSEMQNLVVR